MKFFIVSCLLLGASALHEEVIKAKWAAYKAKHGKEYHPSEEEVRLNNFLEATIQIENHNARFHRGEVDYTLAHNHLSDLSHEEFKATRLGRRRMDIKESDITETASIDKDSLPPSVNWTSINTPIKDQGSCGSCYAFAVVGVVEALLYNKTREELDLSEQQIVDCSYHMLGENNEGCYGGNEIVTLFYIILKGLMLEGEYPYTSGVNGIFGHCLKLPQKVEGKGLEFKIINKNEDALAQAVAQYGPVIISISGENLEFRHYKSGIYSSGDCPKDTNHVLSVVGYGSEGGKNYWIVRNSWGTDWGENGYGRILRGVNQCGLVTDNPYAVIIN